LFGYLFKIGVPAATVTQTKFQHIRKGLYK